MPVKVNQDVIEVMKEAPSSPMSAVRIEGNWIVDGKTGKGLQLFSSRAEAEKARQIAADKVHKMRNAPEKTAAEPSKSAVKAWMKRNVQTYVDPKTGEVNMTTLAEDAAGMFDKKGLDGWLDDDTHWVWDLAAIVAEDYEKTTKKASPERVAARAVSKVASTPEQWEKAEKLILGGAAGDITKVSARRMADLNAQYAKIDAEFKDATRVLGKHKSMGVGRTEAPALLLRPLREMKHLSDLLKRMGEGMDVMIAGALKDTGQSPNDL